MSGRSNTGDDSPYSLELKAQHLEASLQLKKLAIAKLAKRLVPWADIVTEWFAKVEELRKVLAPLGKTLAPLLEGKDIHERRTIIDAQVVKILEPLT